MASGAWLCPRNDNVPRHTHLDGRYAAAIRRRARGPGGERRSVLSAPVALKGAVIWGREHLAWKITNFAAPATTTSS